MYFVISFSKFDNNVLYVKKSPVEISQRAIAIFFVLLSKIIDIKKLFCLESKRLSSKIVPGVITLTTPLLTIPFTVAGSSNCSQIAILKPAFISFLI